MEDESSEIHGYMEHSAGCTQEALSRFMSGKGNPSAGLKMLSRWHNTDWSGGFALYETDNPSLLYENSAAWADVLEIHGNTVLEDAEVGPVLARVFGK